MGWLARLVDRLLTLPEPMYAVDIRPPMGKREFLATDGKLCPWCRSNDVRDLDEDFRAADDIVWRDLDCNNCGGVWTIFYALHHYEPIGDDWQKGKPT